MMKERFSKLLLGEDMSGSGKGVCTAVTISNAITNLYGMHNTYTSTWFIKKKQCSFFLLSSSLSLLIFDTFFSNCVWAKFEIRAIETWEEIDVEERNGLPSFRMWLHSRIYPQVSEFTRRNSSWGEVLLAINQISNRLLNSPISNMIDWSFRWWKVDQD